MKFIAREILYAIGFALLWQAVDHLRERGRRRRLEREAAQQAEQRARQYRGVMTGSQGSGTWPETNVSPLKLPGCGLPIDWMPDHDEHFPVQTGDESGDWRAATLLIREICMLHLVEQLTNKPEWWRKVHDPVICEKWKAEALTMPWAEVHEHADFTPAMFDFCMVELRGKADLYEKTDLIPVMDYDACVLKSDKLIPDPLWDALRQGVKPLEDVPASRQDWHPGSDDKVLDLVHPSLWPLMYGTTRVLLDKTIGLDDALDHCGMGETIPQPSGKGIWGTTVSLKFQWLPCDIAIDGSRAKIESYINNLHPVHHRDLYPVIEKFIEKALPAWDLVYRWPSDLQRQRLKTDTAERDCRVPEVEDCEHEPWSRPVGDDEPEREEDEPYEASYDGSERERRDNEWFARTHTVVLPDADLATAEAQRLDAAEVKTTGFFNGKKRVQVIAKLANIHLTPENPSYDGGSWHVEGQLNEHIVATALFYYDVDNVTDSLLDFRTLADKEELVTSLSYEQSDMYSIERTFDVEQDKPSLQSFGSVLTRQGRAIFFPNLYQHHVAPFKLADPSQPGHRKILALFLVDPVIPVVSTANVPPQRRDWWAEKVGQLGRGDDRISRLPPELRSMVMDRVTFPLDEDAAKAVRLELMEERKGLQDALQDEMQTRTWFFCEH